MNSLRAVLIAGFVAVLCAQVWAAKVVSATVDCNGSPYEYRLLTSGGAKQPAVLLLHGAGGTPDSMIEAWQGFAEKNGITLVAPSLPRNEKFETAAPGVFHCVLEDAKSRSPFDGNRIYVFGYSMGGYLAFDAIMFDSENYAGAAIFANGIEPQYESIFEKAKRKVPVALYIGKDDHTYPIALTRGTRAMLEKRRCPLHYRELPGADHNYFAVANEINPETWQFWMEHPALSTAK